jgi:UDP-N-acetylglucosamine--N-acetylmuramyl-(pentapeptide) pyrophosphoryl-undecaprenol N-acetylglucosamine transferase
MGKGLDSNRFFKKELFPYAAVEASALSYKKIWKSVYLLCKGTLQSFSFMKKHKPSVVVGFGSFHTFPVLMAAVFRKIPILLFESNAVPGRVNRLFSRFAEVSSVQFPMAKKGLKGVCQEVCMPIWQSMHTKEVSEEESYNYFSLEKGHVTFLVFGGSQGARFINTVFVDALYRLHKKHAAVQVIHLTGDVASMQEVKKEYAKQGIKAYVKEFEPNMACAWKIADVAICRAGAATLSELIHFEVPSILIPYPYAAEGHQLANALFLERLGGAFCIEEKHISTNHLLSLLEPFFTKHSPTWQTMKQALQEFKVNRSQEELCDLVHERVKGR